MVIWHIDDDPVELEIVSRMIQRGDVGGQIRSFQDARTALEQLEKKIPDLILLDIDMPGMDGWQFLDAIAGRENFPPIVILTASIDPAEQGKALKKRWVKGLLLKPLDIKELAAYTID